VLKLENLQLKKNASETNTFHISYVESQKIADMALMGISLNSFSAQSELES
jgi:hypothetical protein